MSHIQRNLLVFGRLLRSLGLDVHVGRMLDVTTALVHVDVGAREEVYHTCRALLVHRHEDLAIFDRAFGAFWRAPLQQGVHRLPPSGPRDEASSTRDEPVSLLQPVAALEAPPAPGAGTSAAQTWSGLEALAHRDFADFTPDELALGRAALDRLVWHPSARRTRRWIRGRGSRIDLRRALARSLRTGGDLLRLPRLERRTRPRPLVILCDVSGSMEGYSRMLLHFLHGLALRQRRLEAFLFSTRLTRITRHLRDPRLDDAVTAVAGAVPDWSGGTRIGAALREFHQRWGRRVLHGGPVVLIVSDGWDRGDPIQLREEVARLQRSCRRLVWLNPLIGTTDYAPLTRGLQAALPFVDDFLPARTLTNLADLAVHLNALGARG